MSNCNTGTLTTVRPPSSSAECGCDCTPSDIIVPVSLDCSGFSAGGNLQTALLTIDAELCTLSGNASLEDVTWCAPNATTPPATATIQETVEFIAEEFIPRSGNSCDCDITGFLYFADTKGIGQCVQDSVTDNKVYFSGDYTYVDSVDQVRLLNDLKVQAGGFGAKLTEITSTTDLGAAVPQNLALTYNITPASNTTLTLPQIADTPLHNTHRVLIVNHNACDTTKSVTIEGYGGETIDNNANLDLPVGESWILHADGVDDWKIVAKKYSACSDASDGGFGDGYVTFGDEYGWMQQDTARPFYYDKANGRLGINTNSPSGFLHVKSAIANQEMYYDGDTLFIKKATADEKFFQANNDLTSVGVVNGFLDANKSGGWSVDKSDGSTVVKLRGQDDDHSYLNNDYVSVGRSGSSTAQGGVIDGAKFTVNDNTRDPYDGLGDANNWQMMVQSGTDGAYDGAGIAFVVENATKDVNVGAAVLHTKTGNNGKGDLGFYTKESQTDLVDPVLALYIADNQNVGVGSNYDASSSTVPLSTFEVSGSEGHAIQEVNSNDTLDDTDFFTLVDTSSGNVTINLPAAASCTGREYVIKKKSAGNTMTIDPSGGETIDSKAAIVVTNQYATYRIISDGTEWWII